MIKKENIILFPIERTLNFIMNEDNLIKQHVIKETKESFSNKVIELANELKIPYFESVTKIAEDNNMEIEVVGKLISKDLYYKLEIEAEDLSLLKQKKNRLKY